MPRVWGRSAPAFLVLSRRGFVLLLIFGLPQILRAQILDLQAETLNYDENTQVVVATGNVSFVSGSTRIWAKKAKGDLSTNLFHLKGAAFTTCDRERPHYKFRALWARLNHGKNISAVLPVLQWGPVPIFFSPYYFRLLGERALRVDNEYGSNNTSGVFIKNRIGYPTSAGTYSKIYVDYFARRGWGKGAEFTYRNEERVKGSIYGYDIYDRVTQSHRWNIRYFHQQRFARGLDFHASSEVASDDAFSNLFNAQDFRPINRELRNEVGLSLRRSLWSAHLTGTRRDLWEKDRFRAENYSLPAFSFSTLPIRISSSSFFVTGRLGLARTFSRGENFNRVGADGDLLITQVLRLSKRFSLLPGVGWTQNWNDRRNLTNLSDEWRSAYRTELVARTRLSPIWHVDVSHRFQQQLKKQGDPFHGVLSHRVDLFTAARGDHLGVKAGTGLDLRQAMGVSFGPFAKRMDGLFLEATWDPSYHVSLFMREDFNLFLRRFNSVSTEFRLRSFSGSYFETGVSYLSSQPDRLSMRNSVGIVWAPKWRFEFSTQYNLIGTSFRFNEVRFISKEASIARDIHCWTARVGLRERPGSTEFWVTLNIKPPASPKKSAFPETLADEEWYPWRKR